MFKLEQARHAVVTGAGHGIGLALCKRLLNKYSQLKIYASYRRKEKAPALFQLEEQHKSRLKLFLFDPAEEETLEYMKRKIGKETESLDLLINSIGVLEDETLKAEKSLRDINVKHLQKYFLVNSIVTPLLAQYFFSFFRNSTSSCFATISAKIGSISDNKLGGWYGYRASKTAQNMFLKTLSLEFNRRSCPTVALAIHPGTTKTELTEKFLKNSKLTIHTTDESAENILKVIDNCERAQSGQFLSWNGEVLPW